MAQDSNTPRRSDLSGNEAEEETIGLDLTFYKAAVLKIALSTLLEANLVPFDRIPAIIEIANDAKRIALELQPKQKPKIILPDGTRSQD